MLRIKEVYHFTMHKTCLDGILQFTS